MSEIKRILQTVTFAANSGLAKALKAGNVSDIELAIHAKKTKAYKESPELKTVVDNLIANSDSIKPAEKPAERISYSKRIGEPWR